MKIAAVLILLMLAGVTVLEMHPAVDYDRKVVPEEIYVGKDCGCDCISQSRPWYSTFNYWFWLWVLSVPILVFSVKPNAATLKKIATTLVAIGFCYGAMNLAMHLGLDISHGPFWVVSDIPWQKSWDDPGVKCVSPGTGAKYAFTLVFGWLYATVFTGWWQMIWFQYHRRKTGLIDKSYKRDWLSRVVVGVSVIVPTLIILRIFVAFVYHFEPK